MLQAMMFTTVEGGVGGAPKTYPEYSRSVYETADRDLGPAVADLRASHPSTVQLRVSGIGFGDEALGSTEHPRLLTQVSDKTITYCLWIVNNGVGILTDEKVGARRCMSSRTLYTTPASAERVRGGQCGDRS
jgi:hypothetical protein